MIQGSLTWSDPRYQHEQQPSRESSSRSNRCIITNMLRQQWLLQQSFESRQDQLYKCTKELFGSFFCVRKRRVISAILKYAPRNALSRFCFSYRAFVVKRAPSPNDEENTIFTHKAGNCITKSTRYQHFAWEEDILNLSTIRIRFDPFQTHYTKVRYLTNPPNNLQYLRKMYTFQTVLWRWRHQHALQDFE